MLDAHKHFMPWKNGVHKNATKDNFLDVDEMMKISAVAGNSSMEEILYKVNYFNKNYNLIIIVLIIIVLTESIAIVRPNHTFRTQAARLDPER